MRPVLVKKRGGASAAAGLDDPPAGVGQKVVPTGPGPSGLIDRVDIN